MIDLINHIESCSKEDLVFVVLLAALITRLIIDIVYKDE